jgi:hypothetical protein
VSIAEIEPPVWREIEVASTISLARLHRVLQIAFGWENAHLFEFEIDGVRFSDLATSDDPAVKDAERRRLNIVAPSEGSTFGYLYDFGDGWLHHVEVLAVMAAMDRPEALCIAGERACPPEDCGGPYGYAELLEALRDESHERHAELVEWCGASFDPEAFDLEATNDRLLGRAPKRSARTERRTLDPAAELIFMRLVTAGEKLSDDARAEILGLGDQAILPLIGVLIHPDLCDEDDPGAGWAPIHAARLLCDLRAAEAIEPMLALLGETGWDTVIHDAILRDLPQMGGAALEPALRAAIATDDPEFKSSLLGILARLGVRDERILALLGEHLAVDPILVAGDLADYGDPSALPILVDLLDRLEVDQERPFGNQELIELENAILVLGGTLTRSQAAKLDLVRSLRRRGLAPRQRSAAAAKVGRNDPCPCGSGKKYKRCHLEADRAHDGRTPIELH